MPREVDLLVYNGSILTMDGDAGPIRGGWIAVRRGAIEAVGGPESRPDPKDAVEALNADGGLVMPGLVNGHVHAAMTLFRGLADDLPLMTWLNEHIFPAEAAHVKPELVYWGALLACAEMLRSGTTTLADGYFLEDHALRAFREAGLRAVAGQGVIDFPAPGVPDPSDNIKAAERFVDVWRGEPGLVAPSVFCHSPYTCSAETLTRAKDLARRKNVLFQIHVSETAFEVERSLTDHGLRPVEYLDGLGVLDEATLVVHGVHLSEAEIEILARRRTPVCSCPESNMKLASGLAPLPELLEAGVRLALGTDGPAGNNDLNMFGEMRSAALVYKAQRLDPTVLPARTLLDLAGRSGAQALGLPGPLGILAPGFRADLIVLNFDGPRLHPLYNPYSHLVYAAEGREVRTAIIDGRIVLRDGRVLTFDEERVKARVREIAQSIAKKS